MGRLSDLAGEEGINLSVTQGNSIYARIISSNSEINVGEGVTISFMVNGAVYERTTDTNGRAELKISLNKGGYVLQCVVRRDYAGNNPRLEQVRNLTVV